MLLRELIEHLLLERLAHADAGIRNDEPHRNVLSVLGHTLARGERDGAAVLRKLDRIAQNVDQDLTDTHGIRVNIRVDRFFAVDHELQVAAREQTRGNIDCAVHHRCNIHDDRIDRHMAALDAADVQHIIDEREQQLRAVADLIQTVLHLPAHMAFIGVRMSCDI